MTDIPYAAIQDIADLFDGRLLDIDPDDGVVVTLDLDAEDAEHAKRSLAKISAWLATIPNSARYPGLADADELGAV